MPCYRIAPGAIVISVRLTPRADRDAIDGVGALSDGREVARARVRAVAEGGAANAALTSLLAKTFGRPKSSVAVVAGATQRLKQVRIEGDPDKLGEIVAAWPQV